MTRSHFKYGPVKWAVFTIETKYNMEMEMVCIYMYGESFA